MGLEAISLSLRQADGGSIILLTGLSGASEQCRAPLVDPGLLQQQDGFLGWLPTQRQLRVAAAPGQHRVPRNRSGTALPALHPAAGAQSIGEGCRGGQNSHE